MIEFVVRDGLDDFLHRALVEIPLPFGWTAGRGDRWWPSRLADMDENALRIALNGQISLSVTRTRFHGVFAPNSKHRVQVTRQKVAKSRSLGYFMRIKLPSNVAFTLTKLY